MVDSSARSAPRGFGAMTTLRMIVILRMEVPTALVSVCKGGRVIHVSWSRIVGSLGWFS